MPEREPAPTVDEFVEIAQGVADAGGGWLELKRALEERGYEGLAAGIEEEANPEIEKGNP